MYIGFHRFRYYIYIYIYSYILYVRCIVIWVENSRRIQVSGREFFKSAHVKTRRGRWLRVKRRASVNRVNVPACSVCWLRPRPHATVSANPQKRCYPRFFSTLSPEIDRASFLQKNARATHGFSVPSIFARPSRFARWSWLEIDNISWFVQMTCNYRVAIRAFVLVLVLRAIIPSHYPRWGYAVPVKNQNQNDIVIRDDVRTSTFFFFFFSVSNESVRFSPFD